MSTVGVIASPTAGKDVRRLVAHAGTVGDVDKVSMIRRAILGAVEGGADHLLLLPDRKRLCERAIDRLPLDAKVEVLDMPVVGRGIDTVRGATMMRDAGADAVIVFGGDGTSRDVTRGWPDVTLMPMSVGTNNVFPSGIEPTIGGIATGLVASGRLARTDVAQQSKLVHVTIPAAEAGADPVTDIGLVDVVLIADEMVGSRAVWEVDDILAAVFAIAKPASIGLSSIGGLVHPCLAHHDGGVFHTFGGGSRTVRAPIAPGSYETVHIDEVRPIGLDEEVQLSGPGTLAFDGERDHMLTKGQDAKLVIRRDGPWVIDPEKALTLAAERGLFVQTQTKNSRK